MIVHLGPDPLDLPPGQTLPMGCHRLPLEEHVGQSTGWVEVEKLLWNPVWAARLILA